MTPEEWAQEAAQRLLADFEDGACIETANYQLCDFILEAARLAVSDPALARRIGLNMEVPRDLRVRVQYL